MRAFGTLTLSRGRWVMDAEPHVIIRAKRAFRGVLQRQGRLFFPDTLELCRELQWFMDRYPLSFGTSEEQARLESRAEQFREQESLVDQLLRGERPSRKFELALPPRDYQAVAAEIAQVTGGLLIADDVGLGKTCTSICALLDPSRRPALIVTLAHLTRQWEAEIQKFAPGMTTHILKRSTPYDLTAPAGTRSRQRSLLAKFPDVIITSYHKLSGWSETLAGLVRSVVFDEVQELRRGKKANKGEAAYHLARHAALRIGLSATPIYNYGGEIYCVMEAIRPGALGSKREFEEQWCTRTFDEKRGAPIANPQAFGTYLRSTGLMIRRTRAEVGRELPGLTRVPHHVDADRDALEAVEDTAIELAQLLAFEGPTKRAEKLRAAEALSSLVRQATGVAKAPHVADFVRILVESGERVVLFGWHRKVYDIWLERLQNLNPVLYTGTESPAAKDRARRAFVEGETNIFIMSLRSGAGLDGLQQVCRTTVFGELDWSPAVHEQCEGRILRDEQQDPVMSYYLLADSGSDPTVSDVLGLKREQVDGIRNPTREVLQDAHVDGSHVQKLAAAYLKKRSPLLAAGASR